MATIAEITALLSDLSEKNLEEVRTFVEFLRSKQLNPEAAAWCYDFLENYRDATVSASRDPAGMETKVADAVCAGISRPALVGASPGFRLGPHCLPGAGAERATRREIKVLDRDSGRLRTAGRSFCVAFRVLVNGWKLWSTVKNKGGWEDHQVAMPQLSSDGRSGSSSSQMAWASINGTGRFGACRVSRASARRRLQESSSVKPQVRTTFEIPLNHF